MAWPRLDPGQPEDCQVVCLGSAGGEDHLARLGPQDPGNRLPRGLPGPPCPPPRRMTALGISGREEIRTHRLQNLRVKRRRCVVIEIDHPDIPASAKASESQQESNDEQWDTKNEERARPERHPNNHSANPRTIPVSRPRSPMIPTSRRKGRVTRDQSKVNDSRPAAPACGRVRGSASAGRLAHRPGSKGLRGSHPAALCGSERIASFRTGLASFGDLG